jgi:hypothetical protein
VSDGNVFAATSSGLSVAIPEPSISIMGFLGAAMLFRRKR